MKPTIVTLSPRQNSSNTVRVATFEEAFGDFSEARGRKSGGGGGSRKEARQEKKAQRKEARQEKKAQRQEVRQEKRAEPRGIAKVMQKVVPPKIQQKMAEKRAIRQEKIAQRKEEPQYEDDNVGEGEGEYETSHPQGEVEVVDEQSSNARGGRGGGGRMGGGRPMGGRPMGGRRGGGRYHQRHRNWVGGYYWNGVYWVDANDICYTKNWLGQYIPVNCGAMSSVEFGV